MKGWKQKRKEDMEREVIPGVLVGPYVPLIISTNTFKCPECKYTGTCKPSRCATKAYYDELGKKE